MGEHVFQLSPKLNKLLKSIKINDFKIRPDIFCLELKRAASRFWTVGANNIAVNNGSDQFIWLIPRVFMNPGDKRKKLVIWETKKN